MTDAKNILDNEPEERKIDWFWEPQCNKGNTIFAKWAYLNYEGVVVLSGKAHDMKNGIIEYQKSMENFQKLAPRGAGEAESSRAP